MYVSRCNLTLVLKHTNITKFHSLVALQMVLLKIEFNLNAKAVV